MAVENDQNTTKKTLIDEQEDVLYVEPTDNDSQSDIAWDPAYHGCPLERVGSLSWKEEQERKAKKRNNKNFNFFQ
jgi:hypothetical protein